MYELYIGNKNYSTWSLRAWVLMRERGIPFEERLVPFAEGSSYASFRGFSPTGRVPCLVAGDTTVWDSLAITEYLAERHEGVWPAAPRARAWARCAAAEMHSGFPVLRERCTNNIGIRVRIEARPPALESEIARIEELWTDGVARFGGPFLAGAAFTAADAFFAPVAFRVQTYGIALQATAAAYASRLLALPSMLEWQAAALRETWREPGHEAEARAAGTWIADLRAS
ncbi:MAG TPA: glutathione S-transferase [Steroidobacteraceae bacterium]|nr:glutathione S-transferase [Steroidobacteraceae bacterium]